MDDWDDQLLHERSRLLEGDTTDEIGRGLLLKGHHPRQSRRAQAHVGVEEEQQIRGRFLRQVPAGERLAAPAGRQLRSVQQPHARIGRGELANDRGGRVVGMIVEHDDLEIDVLACQHSLDGRPDRPFFVPRRDENRDARSPFTRRRRGWRLVDP
jgi:hypothetical protein